MPRAHSSCEQRRVWSRNQSGKMGRFGAQSPKRLYCLLS